MTQEEKAKAYDEAIERAKDYYHLGDDKHKMAIDAKAVMEYKRIRKALKQYFVNSFQNNGVAAICGVHIKDVLAWLEKKGEQKTEWSEEDEQRLEDVIREIRARRPKKQWKPSDEQMNALNDVISSRDIKYDVLSELWNDLEKLREERL